jgi:thioredoxin-dependent peroxiredoxin
MFNDGPAAPAGRRAGALRAERGSGARPGRIRYDGSRINDTQERGKQMFSGLQKGALAVFSAAVVSLAVAAPMQGQSAPGFRLQDQNNEWHALADYSGQWVVLYFYPKADTPGCTTEACEFRDNIFAYEELGAAILGVSLDDVASQKEFSEKYHLPFPLLSDAKQEVATTYGVLTTFRDMPVASRQTFLIDPQGRVAKHYENVDPATHSTEVLADLKTLM